MLDVLESISESIKHHEQKFGLNFMIIVIIIILLLL